jgi:hypothetical protein
MSYKAINLGSDQDPKMVNLGFATLMRKGNGILVFLNNMKKFSFGLMMSGKYIIQI